jgi:hypothetical protein
MSTCPISSDAKHRHVYPVGAITQQTCMTQNNTGSTSVVCEWCGLSGWLIWHEEEQQVEGRGPYARRSVRVSDGVRWTGDPAWAGDPA